MLLTAILSGVCAAQTIRFVNVNAAPDGDGMSWATAYTSLFDALDEAALDSSIEQIWVAQGFYTPDRGKGNRNDTFQLVSGVSVYGGFVGDETKLGQQNPQANPTILSGDFNGDDEIVLPEGDIPGLPIFLNYGENAKHVISGFNLTDLTIFDGFIVTSGFADFPGDDLTGGAGLIVEQGNITIANCLFEANRAGFSNPDIGGFGGAIYINGGDYTIANCQFITNRGMNGGAIGLWRSDAEHVAHGLIIDCEFTGNFAEQQTGGAVWATNIEELSFINCSFSNNFAQYGGAIVDHETMQPATKKYIGCTFENNTSLVTAGAIWHTNFGFTTDTEPALIKGCQFVNNSTSSNAVGGALSFWSTHALVVDCEFKGNSAGFGGAITTNPATGQGLTSGDLDVFNCVFSGNSASTSGGAIWTHRCQELRIGANTFTENSAEVFGGAVFISQTANASPALVNNCVFWNNDVNGDMSEFGQIIGGDKEMTHCLVQGLFEPGDGNIDADPLFVDAANGDFRLGAGSPAIDAGSNFQIPTDEGDLDGDGDVNEPLPLDLDANPRFVDDPNTRDTGLGDPPIVDVGAYEFQSAVLGDLDGDGTVGVPDLLMLLASWGPCDGCDDCPADLDDNCTVGVSDLLILLANWG